MVQGKKLLLIRRADNALWDIPGGAVESGEEVLAAAQRELTEEAGVAAPSATLLDVFSGPAFQHTYPDGNVVDWVTMLFITQEVQGPPRAGDDAALVQWWPLNALPEVVSTATQRYFQAILSHVGGQS